MEFALHPRSWLLPVSAACLALTPMLALEVKAEVTCIMVSTKNVKGKKAPFLSIVKRAKKCKAGEVLSPAGQDRNLQ